MRRKTKESILMTITGVAFFLNFAVINSFPPGIEELMVAGYAILGIGSVFFILSIFTLRSKGTDNIAESGIYGVVRHPMYLGAMVMFLSHLFFNQHWIVAVSSVAAIVSIYETMRIEDQSNVEKFRDDYKRYMEKVPRANPVLGILRLIRERKRTASQ